MGGKLWWLLKKIVQKQGNSCVSWGDMMDWGIMISIKSSEFNEEHLKLSGVWTWESDPFKSEDSLIPVPLTDDALSEADSLLIHAKFTTPAGNTLNGLIICDLFDDDVFAIEILVKEQKFTFNKFLPDLSVDTRKHLAKFLSEDVDKIFPLHFSVVPKELAIKDGEFSA